MRRMFILPLVCVTCALAACQFMPIQWEAKQTPKLPVQKTAPIAAESVLYARDGSIVTPGGGSTDASLPRRDVQGGEGSRAKILELYQRVVDERDRLQLSLAERGSEVATLHKQLEAASAHAKEFETRMRSAEQSTSELTNQNLELAGRLTMAQIRRLEAEKKWLELSISLPSKTVAAVENAQVVTGRDKTESTSMNIAPAEKTAVKTANKNEAPASEHH